MVLHHQDMTVNNGLNAYLRGKSQHRPAIHFAALAELSPRMVDWAISRLEEEGMLRRIIGPVPILALSQKGLDWVKANDLVAVRSI